MKKSTIIRSFLGILVLVVVELSFAEVPLNSLDGAGGIAFNPLAYTAGKPIEDNGWISKPQFGAWYVKLADSHIAWSSYSLSLSLANRVEVSYAYNLVNASDYGDNNIEANSLGIKVRLLDENAFDSAWVPAIAIGAVYRHTDTNTTDLFGLDHSGAEYYIVASKLITQLPLPVLVSGGLHRSDEVVYGVVGHNHYGTGVFANIDVLPAENVAIGVEYRQGIDVGDGIENADYWEGHVAWFVTKQLTLVGAYVNTGKTDKGFGELGVGDGFVLSAQFQF
ncbi:MAG: DUF3034 family protein [Victivallales bacterium]|nr:DUF3034 family protein [Victivallales bacterium]